MDTKEAILEKYIEEEDSTGAEYEIYTNEEADERAKEYILESLWAFTPSFLAYHCNLDEKVIRDIQEKMYEDANEVFDRLITDKEDFIEGAIQTDGRGHFLSSYDGEEVEYEGHYVYRIN